MKIKQFFFSIIPDRYKHNYRLRKYANYRKAFEFETEITRIKSIPRYSYSSTYLLKNELKFTDSASFLFIYNEIFNTKIYEFISKTETPTIIDAGANIGLSTLYFKTLYPKCKIIAFEPDKKTSIIFDFNIKSFNLKNVKLIRKALWKEETVLKFYSEGADGGRIALEEDNTKIIEVETTTLRPFLNQKIDLLKIDIEGAECEVLENCQDLLYNVDRVFIEFHSFINKKQDLDVILKILVENDFRYYLSPIGISSPQPYIKINQSLGMDFQINIYAYK